MFRSFKDRGMEWELADEFEQYKAQHKYSVLMAKMIDYYATIMENELQIPDFMDDDTPEKRAEKDIRNLYNRDKNEFNRLYEVAWAEIAEMMD